MLTLSLLANDPIVVAEASEFLRGTSIEFQRYFIELTAANRWVGPVPWSVGLSNTAKASLATKAALVVLSHVPPEQRRSDADFHDIVFKSCVPNQDAVIDDIVREARSIGIPTDGLRENCHQFIFNISNTFFLPHNYEPFSRAWKEACDLAKGDLVQTPVMTLINAPGCSAFATGACLATQASQALVGVHSGLLGFHQVLNWMTLRSEDNSSTHEQFAFAAAMGALLLGLRTREKTRNFVDRLLPKRELTDLESGRIRRSLHRILTLVLLHEIGHITNGHVVSVLDAASTGSAIPNDLSRQWEHEADEYAVKLLATRWKPEIWLYDVFPAWTMLSYAEEWFVKRDGNSTHPRLGIRIMRMIDTLLKAGLGSVNELQVMRRHVESIQSMPLPDFQITMHQWAYLEEDD